MAKAALYSAKLRLKLPLWEAPLPLLTKLPACPGGRARVGLGAVVPNHFSRLCTMFWIQSESARGSQVESDFTLATESQTWALVVVLRIWPGLEPSALPEKLLEVQILGLHPFPATDSETLRIGPSKCFRKPRRWFWYMLQFENHWHLEPLGSGIKETILESYENQSAAKQLFLSHFPPTTPS